MRQLKTKFERNVMNLKLKKGDRVKLIKLKRDWVLAKDNPLVGSQYECEGTITDVRSSCYRVGWDNGEINSGYTDEHLEHDDSLKMGDEILVGVPAINPRIFVKYGKNGGIICVTHGDEDRFKNGDSFNTAACKNWRKKPSTKTITINGKDIEISEESFEALKKQLIEG